MSINHTQYLRFTILHLDPCLSSPRLPPLPSPNPLNPPTHPTNPHPHKAALKTPTAHALFMLPQTPLSLLPSSSLCKEACAQRPMTLRRSIGEPSSLLFPCTMRKLRTMKMSSFGILSASAKKSAGSISWVGGLPNWVGGESESASRGPSIVVLAGIYVGALSNDLVDWKNGKILPFFSLFSAASVRFFRAFRIDSSVRDLDKISMFPNPQASAICRSVVLSNVRRERQKRAISWRNLGVMET